MSDAPFRPPTLPPRTVADQWVGRTLQGRYRIESLLGEGGLGAVYLAQHLTLDRPVAVKVLHADMASNASLRDRFDREIKTLSLLAHPHIVSIVDSGVDGDGVAFLVMELLEGETLERRVAREGSIEPTLAIEVVRQMLLALIEAHRRGVLHRDLKPANVFVQPLADGSLHVKLLDFGLAKIQSDALSGPGDFPTLTADGTIVGTPTYMAPEQAAAGAADVRSDLYALGIVAFEMLAGRPPFVGASKLEVIRAHLTEPPPSLASVHPGLHPSKELDAFVRRALEKDRADRFDGAQEMLAALDALPRPVATVDANVSPRAPAIEGTESTISLRSSALETASAPKAPSKGVPSTKAPAARPSRVAPSRLGLVVFAILIMGAFAVVGLGSLMSDDEGEPTVHATSTDPDADPADDGAEPDEPALHVAGDPPNPFSARELAPELRASRRNIVRGRWLSEAQRREVTSYQLRAPTDPLPSLLLARHHRLKNDLPAATRHYLAAHRIDPMVRGFSPMLADLVRASAHHTRSAAAGRAVVSIYGADALPEVDRLLAQRDLTAGQRQRLERLRARIERAQ